MSKAEIIKMLEQEIQQLRDELDNIHEDRDQKQQALLLTHQRRATALQFSVGCHSTRGDSSPHLIVETADAFDRFLAGEGEPELPVT